MICGTAARHGVQREYRMSLCRNAHAINQRDSCVDRHHLAFMVMRKRRQRVVNKLDAAAIEQRPIARYCHQHRPAAVIGYADDAFLGRVLTSMEHDSGGASTSSA